MKARSDATNLPPDKYHEIRYEHLTKYTREVMEETCAFVGEPFVEAVLKPTGLRPNRLSAAPWLRPDCLDGRVLTDNSEKWKYALSPQDQLLLESVAGDLLKVLGYETQGYVRHIFLAERIYWRAQNVFWYVKSHLPGLARRDILLTFIILRWADTLASVHRRLTCFRNRLPILRQVCFDANGPGWAVPKKSNVRVRRFK